MRDRISPCRPRPTASGLIIAKVRSRVTENFLHRDEDRRRNARLYDFNAAATLEPRSAGVSTVWIPAAAIAAYLSFAVPWPPLMIAPAWPIRRPGGAVCPAMKPTTG